MILFFSLLGFEFISTLSEEAINTQQDVPKAMLHTVIICSIIYVSVAISMVGMGLGRNTEDYIAETAMADSF
jgi:APA family basic amino acid/polyamine antiporter